MSTQVTATSPDEMTILLVCRTCAYLQTVGDLRHMCDWTRLDFTFGYVMQQWHE